MKQRESLRQALRYKTVNDLLAFGTKYTVFSEYWQSLKEGEGLEIERIRDFEIDDDPDSLDLEDLGYLERSSIVYRALEGVPIMIFADVSPSLALYPENPRYSKALIRDIAAAILINSAYESMVPVGLVLFSDRVERLFTPQSGQYARYILDQFLAFEIEEERRGTSLSCINPYLREFPDATALIISDFQDEELDKSLFWRTGIGELDIIPVVVRDPLEKVDFKNETSFVCRDLEKEKDFSLRVTEKRWQEVQRASRIFYRSLFQKFAQLEMGHIVLDCTDIDKCHQRLQQFFSRRFARLHG